MVPVSDDVQLSVLPDAWHLLRNQEKVPDMEENKESSLVRGCYTLGMGSPSGFSGSWYSFRLASETSGIVFGHLGISRASEKSCSPEPTEGQSEA